MKVAIIGGGLAGLSAGCELADAGHEVLLFERRPWAGGKTYSFRERESGEQVDNGQHIAMRCTEEYVRFMERIGSSHLMRWQRRMSVPVIDADGRRSSLRADAWPAPLHMLRSFIAYRHLSVRAKLRIARAIVAVRRARIDDSRLNEQTFGAWLRAHGQTSTEIDCFWDLIIVPALDCRSDDASAAQAIFVFQQGFLRSSTSAAVGVPAVVLSQLHVEPALRYIEERGGSVQLGGQVQGVETDGERASGVLLADGSVVTCDAVIIATPVREALALLPERLRDRAPFADLARFPMSPIINVHLWFDRPVLDLPFVAFTGCDLQWAFNPVQPRAAGTGQRIVISLSAAERYMALDKQALQELLLPQLQRALPASRGALVLRCVAIKEPEATFVPAPGLRRPAAETPIRGLYLAGAYTDTGWPATMESAVRSGLAAARAGITGSVDEVDRAREMARVG